MSAGVWGLDGRWLRAEGQSLNSLRKARLHRALYWAGNCAAVAMAERPAPDPSPWIALRDSVSCSQSHVRRSRPCASCVCFRWLSMRRSMAGAEPDCALRSMGEIPNRSDSIAEAQLAWMKTVHSAHAVREATCWIASMEPGRSHRMAVTGRATAAAAAMLPIRTGGSCDAVARRRALPSW